jgi:hypothetical protein
MAVSRNRRTVAHARRRWRRRRQFVDSTTPFGNGGYHTTTMTTFQQHQNDLSLCSPKLVTPFERLRSRRSKILAGIWRDPCRLRRNDITHRRRNCKTTAIPARSPAILMKLTGERDNFCCHGMLNSLRVDVSPERVLLWLANGGPGVSILLVITA